jgi:hypothetical protein
MILSLHWEIMYCMGDFEHFEKYKLKIDYELRARWNVE